MLVRNLTKAVRTSDTGIARINTRYVHQNQVRLMSKRPRKVNEYQKRLRREEAALHARPMRTISDNIKPSQFTAAEVSHSYVPVDQDNDLFAVVALAGSQYKVTVGDLLVVNRLPDREAPIGGELNLTDVLLIGSKNESIVGRPLVEDAKVRVLVQEHSRDKKIIIFRRRRRKNSQTWNGFRRDITLLRIKDITCPQIVRPIS